MQGVRVWICSHKLYKGTFGYVLSADPYKRTALVQRDGVLDSPAVKIDMRDLIDWYVYYKCDSNKRVVDRVSE